MLRPIGFYAMPFYLFSQCYTIDSICRKSFSLAGFFISLSLLSPQPVGGQQPVEPNVNVIESRAHYSFSTPQSNAEQTGFSEAVLIERLPSEAENAQLSTPSLGAVVSPVTDEKVPQMEGDTPLRN